MIKPQLQRIQNNFSGHPSRETEDDVKKLKEIVLLLAQQIDNLIQEDVG